MSPVQPILGAFAAGAVAGYAIAIPVGAIAVLIVETGLRRGFRIAAAAGAGAATADLIYATLAVTGGAAIAGTIAPIAGVLRIGAAVVLFAIGGRGLVAVIRDRRSRVASEASGSSDARQPRRRSYATYGRFLGLTLLNPATVIYFAGLTLGLPSIGRGPAERGAFVAGAFLASLSWQSLLAAIGSIGHHRLPPWFRVGVSLAGNLVIVALAVRVAAGPV